MVKASQKKATAVMSMVRTQDIMNRFLEIELGKYGSNPPRFAVMNALIVHGGTMRPSEISKCIFRAKHTVTSMLKALENIGYVKRIANENDRRSVKIVVTEKGWKSTDMMMPIAQEISQQILSCLDEEQIETLMITLRQIRRHLLTKMTSSGSAESAQKRRDKTKKEMTPFV